MKAIVCTAKLYELGKTYPIRFNYITARTCDAPATVLRRSTAAEHQKYWLTSTHAKEYIDKVERYGNPPEVGNFFEVEVDEALMFVDTPYENCMTCGGPLSDTKERTQFCPHCEFMAILDISLGRKPQRYENTPPDERN